MGDCFSSCLGGERYDDDPLLNAEARRRAAEAAQARQEAYSQSAVGKRQRRPLHAIKQQTITTSHRQHMSRELQIS